MNKKGSTVIVTLVVILLIGLSAVSYFWLGPKIFIKNVDTAHDIIDKTYTADNAIYNYEWFKTQYEKIGQTEKQIDNTIGQINEFKDMYGDPTEWDMFTRDEYSRLSTIKLGQMNHYESLVAEYNARSNMANRVIFKDSLPYSVDKKLW